MKFIFSWFGRKKKPVSERKKAPMKAVPQFYGNMEPHELSMPPLHDQVKQTQQDFIQKLFALGRANAHARQVLAERALINVRGKHTYHAANH